MKMARGGKRVATSSVRCRREEDTRANTLDRVALQVPQVVNILHTFPTGPCLNTYQSVDHSVASFVRSLLCIQCAMKNRAAFVTFADACSYGWYIIYRHDVMYTFLTVVLN